MAVVGTDALAVMCIVGGAAVAGGLTMAVGEDRRDADIGCASVTLESGPRVSVSIGGESGMIVVAPSIGVSSDCAGVAVTRASQTDRVRGSVERARRRVERARERVHRVEQVRLRAVQERLEGRTLRLEEVDLELEGLEELLEGRALRLKEVDLELEGLEQLIEVQLEGALDSELQDRMERLERNGGEVGG